MCVVFVYEETDMKITGLGTHLKVRDIAKSKAFYDSLGFVAVFGYGDDEWRSGLGEGVATAPEKYRGLTYQISDSANLEIAEGHVAVPDKAVYEELIMSPKISAMVKVDSLEPLFTNPLVELKVPVRHYYWGTIEAAFRDPDGFVLVMIAQYSDEELERVKKYVEVEVVKP
jgi:catechol 2,3-dioxygenase-like lactoylglutathione lyase family enzyme